MGERGHPSFMPRLGCMEKSWPCKCSIAAVWLYISVPNWVIGFEAPAS